MGFNVGLIGIELNMISWWFLVFVGAKRETRGIGTEGIVNPVCFAHVEMVVPRVLF